MSAIALPAPITSEPMADLNTTPLIDVMLVLLIMFIITIPSQAHMVRLDLPNGPSTSVPLDREKNLIVITAGQALLFNGHPVSKAELQSLLLAASQLPEEPELQLQPAAEAPYGLVDEVLVMTGKAGLHRVGFLGNQAFAHF